MLFLIGIVPFTYSHLTSMSSWTFTIVPDSQLRWSIVATKLIEFLELYYLLGTLSILVSILSVDEVENLSVLEPVTPAKLLTVIRIS